MFKHLHKNKFLYALLCLTILCLSLCGCAVKKETKNNTENRPFQNAGKWLDKKFKDTEEPVTDAEDTIVEQIDRKTTFSWTDFCYAYMLDETKENNENCVFSPESLKISLDLYATVLTPGSADEIHAFTDRRDFLEYESTNAYKIVNRLWVNSNKDFHEDKLPDNAKDTVYKIDMSDKNATNEKNAYVKEQTNGFIETTPTTFDNNLLLDAMNIVYFKDSWRNGDKPTVDDYEFNNIDQTTSKVTMIKDQSHYAFYVKNASIVNLAYQDGFEFVAILPDEGVELEDIDMTPLLTNSHDDLFCQQETSDGRYGFKEIDGFGVSYEECKYMIPEFEIKNMYQISHAAALHFGVPIINPDISSNKLSSLASTVQVARIIVDHTGTEAAAVSETILNSGAAMLAREPKELIFNRPFAFIIYDTKNDDIAFIGAIRKL